MKVKALDRDSRKRQILMSFAVNIQSGGNGDMTLGDIAGKMGLSASTKLREMVHELEMEGLLTNRTEPIPGIVGFRRIYSPTALFDAERGKPKHQHRTILINTRRNGQLAMFTEIIS